MTKFHKIAAIEKAAKAYKLAYVVWEKAPSFAKLQAMTAARDTLSAAVDAERPTLRLR